MNIDQIITEHFDGSTKKAREAFGVTRAAISLWRRDGKIPEMRLYQLQVLTQGKFKKQVA